MLSFFNAQSKAKDPKEVKAHVVGMTQYYVGDFSSPSSPDYVSTYDITSCVILLLKNIKQDTCHTFAMGHFNYSNIYFLEMREKNLKQLVDEFEKAGGNLKTASIQLIGGLCKDQNEVREKLAIGLKQLASKKGIKELKIDVPENLKLDTGTEQAKNGNNQILTIACNQKETYARKVTIKNNVKLEPELYPSGSDVLSNKNLKNIVGVDQYEYLRLKEKTNQIYQIINQLQLSDSLQSIPQQLQDKGLKELLQEECALEKTEFKSPESELSKSNSFSPNK